MQPPSQLPGPIDRSRRPVCGLCLCAVVVGKALPVQTPCTLVLLTCLLVGPPAYTGPRGCMDRGCPPTPRPSSLGEPPPSGRPPPPRPAASSFGEAPALGSPHPLQLQGGPQTSRPAASSRGEPPPSGRPPPQPPPPMPALSAIDTFPSSKGCMFSPSGLQITSNFTVFFP